MAKKGSKRFAKNQSKSAKKNKKTRKPNLINLSIPSVNSPSNKIPNEILPEIKTAKLFENQDIENFGSNIGKHLKFETRKFSILTTILIGILIILSFVLG